MTISLFGSGTLAQDAATITPTYPASTVAGQLAVLLVVSGTTDETTPSTPSGWTLATSLSGGSGTFGSNTGPRRVTFFVRELVGGDSKPTSTVPSGTGSFISGQIFVLARSGGTGWRYTATAGVNIGSGTGFVATCPDAVTWAPGDFSVVGYGLPASTTASLSAEAVVASGITFGTVTEQADVALTAGNRARFGLATGAATAGSGSHVPTISATLGATSTGVAAILRVRQASAAITATPQTVFPPRNLVTVSGMLADDIVTASIYEQYGDVRVAVRAASSVDVTGSNALLRVDAEQPFGVPVTYAADLVDVNGDIWTVTASPLTSTVAADIVSDAVQGIGAAVQIEAGFEKARSRDATTMNVGGRMIVVSRRRGGATGTLTVRTETDTDGDALEQLLQGATEGVVQIRKRVTMPRLDGYVAVTDDTERPTWYDEFRWWDLTTVETEAWPNALEAAGFTLADIAGAFPGTLADLATAFPGSLLDLAQYDFGA